VQLSVHMCSRADMLNVVLSSVSVAILSIGVDLAGLLGGRMASAEGGSVSSGMAYG